MFDTVPPTTDVEFLDVQETAQAGSELPFADLENWTVLAVCGDAPGPTNALTSVRAVVAPDVLLGGVGELEWLSQPLRCPTGWYTTE